MWEIKESRGGRMSRSISWSGSYRMNIIIILEINHHPIYKRNTRTSV
jgi:hypothetical protein